jgi:hypothetical protein
MGAGLLGGAAFGGQTSTFTGGNGVSVGQAPRLTNCGIGRYGREPDAEIVGDAFGGIRDRAFYGNFTETFVGQIGAGERFLRGQFRSKRQVAYDRILNPKDQIALSYGYQGFDFSVAGTAFHSNVIQGDVRAPYLGTHGFRD